MLILMCANQMCELKDTCYRFKAKPSYYQSYEDFEPELINGKLICNYYWEL